MTVMIAFQQQRYRTSKDYYTNTRLLLLANGFSCFDKSSTLCLLDAFSVVAFVCLSTLLLQLSRCL